jgi:uncharacterized membrane protein
MDADLSAGATFLSSDRLVGLSDGMFGVAMTLLSTTLIVPVQKLTGSAFEMLYEIGGALFVVTLSFAICGAYWLLHQRQLAMSPSLSPRQTVLHFIFLFSIVLLPISTALLGGSGATQPVIMVYGMHLVLISVLNLLLWMEFRRRAIVRERIIGSMLTTAVFVGALAIGAVRPWLAPYFWYAGFAMPWLGRRLCRLSSKSQRAVS